MGHAAVRPSIVLGSRTSDFNLSSFSNSTLGSYLQMRKRRLSEDLSGEPDVVEDQEPLNLSGARQMVSDLVQLIEAKALAHRLAFKMLVQDLADGASPDVALRLQAQLDAALMDPAMLGVNDSALRSAVAQ